MNTTTLLVRKDALPTTQLQTQADAPLQDGQVRLKVESFALTSNNITYAAFGDAMNYWQFFPTQQDGWGVIPVWGFATVVQTLCPGVAVGERLYGYWPTASHVVLTPTRLNEFGFVDGAAHRAALHAVYNSYTRTSTDAFYTPDTEALQSLLRPLFITSWLIDDFFADNDFFGAQTSEPTAHAQPSAEPTAHAQPSAEPTAHAQPSAILSSASSKTAYGTAFQMIQRPGLQVVGLTSPANRAFCESLGCYSLVLTYDELDQMAADTPCVYVDFAGNADLRRAIHTRFAQLRYSCSIGGTHVENLGGARDLPGPKATLFFAPAQIKKRLGDWGPASFRERQIAAWHSFLSKVTTSPTPWVQVQHHSGTAAVQAAYAQVLAGRGDPRVGHILSLSAAAS